MRKTSTSRLLCPILCKLNVTHDDELELCIWLLFFKVKIYCYIYLSLHLFYVCMLTSLHTIRGQTTNCELVLCRVSSRNPAQVCQVW